MRTPRLPLGFLLLMIANLAVLLLVSFLTGFQEGLLQRMPLKTVTMLYLVAAGLLAGLEQALWDKLRGE